MADTFAQGDQSCHAGNDGAMVARKAAVADQAERPLPRADTVDQEFDRTDQDPGDQGRDEVSDIHGVFLLIYVESVSGAAAARQARRNYRRSSAPAELSIASP
ncbi:hypothetical protein D9M70_624160 [compost metagenome]